MKKSSARLSIIVLAVMFASFIFAGCSKLQELGLLPKASAPAGERQYATVTFENITGETLYYLYISEKADTEWGEDWLGENILSDNDTYTTRLLTGEYDVMATDLSGDVSYTFWIVVKEGGDTFEIEPSDKD